ncbi:hypothetical protein C8F01DRAFT_1249174 [Mycena amicta]|nr:hypothetical protein C8F01DRAFT_1249174 [Mycena amicta]
MANATAHPTSKSKTTMKLAMPTCTSSSSWRCGSLIHNAYTDSPELEYTLNLGAESDYSRAPTPQPDTERQIGAALSRRTPTGERMRLSTAYDAAGHLKIAERGRREAVRDCGICDQTAVVPVRTQCCGALFCKEHIDAWIYSPAATGLCPSCEKPCIVSHSDSQLSSSSSSPSSPSSRSPSPSRSRTPTRTHQSLATKTKTKPKPPQQIQTLLPGLPELARVLCGVALIFLLAVLSRQGQLWLA